MKIWSRRLVALMLFIASNAMIAMGLESFVRTSEYAHSVWRMQDGVFNGTPYSIVQSADGYLWIGTSSGVVRFDGVRFLPWTAPSDPSALTDGVYSLGATSDGSLWIGSWTLMRWKDGNFSTYPSVRGRINAILPDPTGGVWFTRSRISNGLGPLCHITDSTIKCFDKGDGIAIPYAGALFRDASGDLWLGGSRGMATGKPEKFETFTPSFLAESSRLGGVGAFADGFDGSMLVGMVQSGQNLGLQEFKDHRWNLFRKPGFDGSNLKVDNLLRARDSSLWIGTFDEGIFVVRGQRVDHFTTADGLSSNVVNDLYEDKEGNIWVVTSGGLDRFSAPRVITFSSRDGLSSDYAGSILATHDGSVWVGNHDALDRIRNGAISSIRNQEGLPGGRVTVLLEEPAGQLWVGVNDTLSVREGERFHTLSRVDGSPVGTLQRLIKDQSGDLWGVPVPSGPQLIHIHRYAVDEETIGPLNSKIMSIAASPTGGILLGFRDGKIAAYKDGRLKTLLSTNEPINDLRFTADGHILALSSGKITGWQGKHLQSLGVQNGLPCDRAFTFLLNRQGTLWLYTPCGLIAIDAQNLQRWWTGSRSILEYRLFDSFDGVQAAWTSFTPPASEGPDEKLWFVNGSTVQTIDPSNVARNDVVPPVHIESVIADRRNYPLQQDLRLPSRTRDLEIDYAALSFTVPQKVRFRYRLEGRDKDWQDPGVRRQAFYTDLPPGRYRFHIIAANNDGVWNHEGASLEFSISPAFYQTLWFKLALATAALLLIWLVYSLRLKKVTAEVTARLGERLQERERIARELHDTLLQDFQAVILQFQAVSKRLFTGDPNRKALEDGLDYADKVLAEGRDRIQDIRADTRAFDELSDAIGRYGKELAQARSALFAITVTGEQLTLDPIIRDEVYRIGREAIGNAFKHSRGSKVEVELAYGPAELRMKISDNGNGMESQVLKDGRPGHWGLPGMRERARKIGATLDLWSKLGEGTRLQLNLPVRCANRNSGGWKRWAHQRDTREESNTQ
ncbi:sensor histidine kinase [Acidicapsa ligni]|uniref:sensor histidine kinase n=1 Tax=Acidicapsa ligni TaxID=542300 RepID=UPI0021E073C3|nr:sensor histidine kinase [Acidicapsa ligni]